MPQQQAQPGRFTPERAVGTPRKIYKMDPESQLGTLLLILGLLAANAFFVAIEFALLTARRAQIDHAAGAEEAAREGWLSRPSRVVELSLAAQIGSSASTILLGLVLAISGLRWWEYGTGGFLRDGLGAGSLSAGAIAVTGVLLAVILHTLLAAQIPKLVGAQRAQDVLGRWVLWPLRAWALVLRPLIWLLWLAQRNLARLVGVSSSNLSLLGYTPDEIRLIVARGHEQGVVEEDEREMIHGVFEFSDTVAREVMTPRTDVIALPLEAPYDEVMRVVTSEGHSRLPVFDESIDNVVGVLLTKDLLPRLWLDRGATDFSLKRLLREPYFVPDTKPVDDLLAEFRQHSVHLAIVLDEFGGTQGLVTMEDLLEEIVGEIHDEYDVARPDFIPTPEGDVLIDGGASISEVNERFGLTLPEEDYDTIGGYIFGELGRVPLPGEVVNGLGEGADVHLEVEAIEDRRITRVRLRRSPEFAAELQAPPAG